MSGTTEVLYVRVPKAVKEALDEFATATGWSLATSASFVLASGLGVHGGIAPGLLATRETTEAILQLYRDHLARLENSRASRGANGARGG